MPNNSFKMLPKPSFSNLITYVFLQCIFLTLGTCQQIDWVRCSDHVPSSDVFDPNGVDLQNLPPTLKCGQLVVPMDYSKPLGVGNNITLGIGMYRPVQPKGVIFL